VPPEPNKVYEYQIELIPVFRTFKAGHKIWVQIASDDMLHFERVHAMYTSEMLPVPAKNTIHHNAEYPSHLLLPVIPDAPEIEPVKPPVSQITWPLPEDVSEFPLFPFPLF
jgi:predicted acyl esterase